MVLCAWCGGRCLGHVELILKINKYCHLLHLVGLDFITLIMVIYFPWHMKVVGVTVCF
jgi:hypothetical protein